MQPPGLVFGFTGLLSICNISERLCRLLLRKHSYLLRSYPTGRAINQFVNMQAARPDEQASKYCAYLQCKAAAGKQQLEV